MNGVVPSYKAVRHQVPGWEPSTGVRVNLACGSDYRPGWVNVDYYAPRVDAKVDLLRFPWAIPSESADWVLVDQYLEHIPPVIIDGQDALLLTLAEIHRVLKPGGVVLVGVPYAGSREDVYNPVHYRRFHPETMDFLTDRETQLGETRVQMGGHALFRILRVKVHRRLRIGRVFDSWYHPLKWLGRYWNVGRKSQIVYLMQKLPS